MSDVHIIDYGLGNLGSLKNMIKKIGFTSQFARNASELEGAKKIILPGVGAFDAAIRQLKETDMIPKLEELVLQHNIPTIGVCVGMQLLTKRSEEGFVEGLGWVDAEVTKFKFADDRTKPVPHMGWREIEWKNTDNIFNQRLAGSPRFYFCHSYFVTCSNPDEVLATADYGHEFVTVFRSKNIYGAQFHPEKSHKFGMGLLTSFIEAGEV